MKYWAVGTNGIINDELVLFKYNFSSSKFGLSKDQLL